MTDKRPILVFDLDGTLADTAPDLIDALNIILSQEGMAALPLASARRLVGAGARALIARGFAEAGRDLPPKELQRLFKHFLAHYEAHIADKTRLFPGVEAALDRLAAAGFVLAVCTNKLENLSHLLLRALRIHERFQAICGQDTFGVAKPDPKFLFATIERAGGDPARAVMIGDSVLDIETARAAGVPSVAVDFGYTDTPVTELGPNRVISHFDGLWEAVAALSLRAEDLPIHGAASAR